MSEQPAPKPGRQDVTPIAQGSFIALLKQREQKGIATYGTSLQAENGRDAIQDAMEECVDLWQYLVQLMLEVDAMRSENKRLRLELDAAKSHRPDVEKW